MPTCSRCKTPLSEETTAGLCPRCLLAMSVESQTLDTSVPTREQLPPPTPDELAGAFPGYEILECLGRGGMGIVYKARQKTLERTVAIKVLAGEWQDDPTFAERFAREARVLAKLNHPHIVTIHDFGESGGLYYLVMEFVDGANLRDVLRDGKIPPEQALKIVPTICEALQYAHDQGVVHRDIKPENLLLDRTGTLKVADFGIASLVGTDTDIRGGTPEYLPPETTSDHRADIYALGVVLYEMLTGERPTKGWQLPSKKVQIDVRIDDVVLRALETDPDRRYQTAAEFGTRVGHINEIKPPTPPISLKTPITWQRYAVAYSLYAPLAIVIGLLGQIGFIEAVLFIAATVGFLIVFCKILYRLWDALPEPYRATTPTKAVGFGFIPIFHFYWVFVAMGNLASGIVAYRQDQGLTTSPHLQKFAFLYCIGVIVSTTIGLNPYVGIATTIFDVIISTLFFREAQKYLGAH